MKLGMFMLWTDSVWAPSSPGSRSSTSEPTSAVAVAPPPSIPSTALGLPRKASPRRARPVIEDEATAS
jgi:hypothetical protein